MPEQQDLSSLQWQPPQQQPSQDLSQLQWQPPQGQGQQEGAIFHQPLAETAKQLTQPGGLKQAAQQFIQGPAGGPPGASPLIDMIKAGLTGQPMPQTSPGLAGSVGRAIEAGFKGAGGPPQWVERADQAIGQGVQSVRPLMQEAGKAISAGFEGAGGTPGFIQKAEQAIGAQIPQADQETQSRLGIGTPQQPQQAQQQPQGATVQPQPAQSVTPAQPQAQAQAAPEPDHRLDATDARTTSVWKAYSGQGGMSQLADHIIHLEGDSGPAKRNNNPGNLKDPATGKFQKFDSMEDGRNALMRQLNHWQKAHPNWSVADLNRVYSPDKSSGGDNPEGTEDSRNDYMMSQIEKRRAGSSVLATSLPR
jgi:hypothetical protein